MKRTIYRIKVGLNRVVSLVPTGTFARVGLTQEQIGSDDFGPCQRVGGAIRWLGSDGLLVPSARSTGTNLVIFPRDDFDFEILDSELLKG